MSDALDTVVEVRMPQVNVNDEEVTLLGWHVSDGGQAVADQPLCEVETSKAVGDVPSPAGGVLKQMAASGDVIAIGQVIGFIGPSMEAIARYISSQRGRDQASAKPAIGRIAAAEGGGAIEATAGAAELARRYGVDLADVPADGRVRRSDVARYVSERGLTAVPRQPMTPSSPTGLPPMLADRVNDEGPLPQHLQAIADHLARTQSQVVVAHLVMDVRMAGAMRWIEARRQGGMMTGPIPVLLYAASAAISAEPRLKAFRLAGRRYMYRSLDIAYTARSADGRLFAPVVRNVDRLTLDELARECGRLSMAVFRGKLSVAEMSGACITVSVLSEHPVRMHLGLQNAYQSAILTAGTIREQLEMVNGSPASMPMVTLALSYDHGLMDGWEAAAALGAAKTRIESIQA